MEKEKIKNFLIFLTILIIFIFSLFNKDFRNKLINFTYLIFSKTGKIFWNISLKINSFFLDFKNFSNLRELNKKLINENLILKQKLIDFENTKEENIKLKKQINIDAQKNISLLPANSWGFSTIDDTIFINKGEKDGIITDLTVITENKILVGKIIKVFENFSQVQLITKKDFSFDIEINNILGIAKGQGNNKLIFDLIPSSSQVSEGDIVKTAKVSGKFFPNLIVGEIKQIEKDERSSYLKGEILPAFLKEDLSILFVIK
ncbi:MAG: rod shape-determining protein MreC [Minisyncoccia bacterium]